MDKPGNTPDPAQSDDGIGTYQDDNALEKD